MKNLIFIFSILLLGVAAKAAPNSGENFHRRGYDGSAYIFVEGDVEFSVFPDGQFDFVYVGPQKGSSVSINTPNVNISFNSGYDYDAYVQYDDYGAVIQVENVPIYYDYYGRIIQAGNVEIQYNDRRIVRVGGLHVFYNNYGYFSHCTGVINVFNPYYVYRPWHVYYAPPIYSHCIVYDMPYRRYYRPVRYSYHEHIVYYKNRNRVVYHNGRRDFYRPGTRVYDKNGRSSINKEYNPNRKNTMIATNNGRNAINTRSNSTIRGQQNRTTMATEKRNSANTRVDSNNNFRGETVNRSSSSNSKGAVVGDRSRLNTNKNSGKISRNNETVATKSRSTGESGRYVRDQKENRTSNNGTIATNRTAQQQTQREVPNRNSTLNRTKTQTSKRETASRSNNSIKKSSTPSRSNSNGNVSRGSSSREVGKRSRG